jgi:hypothetical protein
MSSHSQPAYRAEPTVGEGVLGGTNRRAPVESKQVNTPTAARRSVTGRLCWPQDDARTLIIRKEKQDPVLMEDAGRRSPVVGSATISSRQNIRKRNTKHAPTG